MNPDAFEPIAVLVTILIGVALIGALIGILSGGICIGTAIAAIFASGATKAALIKVAVISGIIAAVVYTVFIGGDVRKGVGNFTSERKKIREYTPLIRAVYKDDVKKVKKLLKKGADPNEIKGDWSPLSMACGGDCKNADEITLVLLEANADPNLKVEVPEKNILRIPLKSAIDHWHVERIQNLIKHGVIIDSIDENTQTPYEFMPVQYALDSNYASRLFSRKEIEYRMVRKENMYDKENQTLLFPFVD